MKRSSGARLTFGLVILAPFVCLASPGFVPCLTTDGPGYQTSLGDLQCIFTNGGILFVSRPTAAHGIPLARRDDLIPGSLTQKCAATGPANRFRLSFSEESAPLAPEGGRPRRELTNVYVGRTPDRWLTARPACDEVVYRQVGEGADLVFTRTAEGLAYEFVGEGAKADKTVHFQWTDITPDTSADGAKDAGSWHKQLQLSPDFGIAPRGTMQWAADASKPAQPTSTTATRALDPSGIAWATYLGGATDGDYAQAIGVVAGDRPVVCGYTYSTDCPVTPGALQDTLVGGDWDAMISALDPDTGQLLWSTYMGGERIDEARSIGRSISGNVLVAGRTLSTSFPTTPGAYDTTLTTLEAAFIGELDAATGQLVWMALVNGTSALGMAVTRDGGIVFTGRSFEGGAPVTAGAYDRIFDGGQGGDGIIARLSSDGRNLDWCTYIGGTGYEFPKAVALDSDENVIVSGYTTASQPTAVPYPATAGAYDNVPGTGIDGFVSKLSADGGSLLWSTYVGSDHGNYVDIAGVLPNDEVVVTGSTSSALYPVTSDAFQGAQRGHFSDAVLTVLSAQGDSLVYSTYLGGDDQNVSFGMCIGADGQIIVSGGTTGPAFPGPDSPDEWVTSGEWDWFVAEFRGTPLTLQRTLVLGGSSWDQVSYVAQGANNSLYWLGDTSSDGLPTTAGVFQPVRPGGFRDLYLAKLSGWVTPVMLSGLKAWRNGDRARVEWALSSASSADSLRIWRETSSSARQLVASLGQVREGPGSWEDASPPAGATSYWLQVTGVAGDASWFGPALLQAAALPKSLRLAVGVPNPFNPRTLIRFALPREERVSLTVFDQRGRAVRTLFDGVLPAGEHEAPWDGRDGAGREMASGVYVVRMVTERGIRSSKVTLAR